MATVMPQAAYADDFDVSINPDGSLSLNGDGFNDATTGDAAANSLLQKGMFVLQFLTGAAFVFFVAILILKAVKYAMSGDNPQAKQAAQNGIVAVLVGTAVAGSATFIIGVVSNLFKM